MLNTLLISLAIAVGINVAVFFIAFFFKTDKLTDFTYGGTFIITALAAGVLSAFVTSQPKILLFAMIAIWAARLAGFLLIRIRKMGRDKRFDEMRQSFFRFGTFWLLQGVSVWIILLPSLMYINTSDPLFVTWSLIGAIVWAAGLSIEAFADLQKYKFSQNPKNKDKWIASGLWEYSRHPNYFGEMLVWIGIFVYTAPALTIAESIFGLISPLYIVFILVFVTGLPKLEKRANEKWGSNKDYQEYKRRTSTVVILPRRK